MRPRSTRRRGSGSGCRRRWRGRSTPTTTTRSPGASSMPRFRRTTCSPACATRRPRRDNPDRRRRSPVSWACRRSRGPARVGNIAAARDRSAVNDYIGSIALADARAQEDGMPKWLSQEWLDQMIALGEDQPERPGASARMQYVITGNPDGEDVRYYWVLENGKLLECQLGDLEDAEVTLTQTYEDAMRIQKGELDANAAFMQGRVK